MSQTHNALTSSHLQSVPLIVPHSVPGPGNAAGPAERADQECQAVKTPETTLSQWRTAHSPPGELWEVAAE